MKTRKEIEKEKLEAFVCLWLFSFPLVIQILYKWRKKVPILLELLQLRTAPTTDGTKTWYDDDRNNDSINSKSNNKPRAKFVFPSFTIIYEGTDNVGDDVDFALTCIALLLCGIKDMERKEDLPLLLFYCFLLVAFSLCFRFRLLYLRYDLRYYYYTKELVSPLNSGDPCVGNSRMKWREAYYYFLGLIISKPWIISYFKNTENLPHSLFYFNFWQ